MTARRLNISVVLCTVRGKGAYINQPLWDPVHTVIADLLQQNTSATFELIVVDGLYGMRSMDHDWDWSELPFPVYIVPPIQNRWVKNKAPAISTYRNTGIAYANGELLVNVDDCFTLPPTFIDWYWRLWKEFRLALNASWPSDTRPVGPVRDLGGEPNPSLYGFNSFPTDLGIALGGYSLAFDGGQGLEDVEFGYRLHRAGLKMAIHKIDGFKEHAQSAHDPRAVSGKIHKCCNRAWHATQVLRKLPSANRVRQFESQQWRDYLGLARCPLADTKNDGGYICRHHGLTCAYPEIVEEADELTKDVLSTPKEELIMDLRHIRRQVLPGKEKYRCN